MSDPVHHPAHYGADRFGIECIAITRYMSFNIGNAFTDPTHEITVMVKSS